MMKKYHNLGYKTKMIFIIFLSMSILSLMLFFSHSYISNITAKTNNLQLLNQDLRGYIKLAAEVEELKRMVLRFSYTGSPFEIDTIESKYKNIVDKVNIRNKLLSKKIHYFITRFQKHINSYYDYFIILKKQRLLQDLIRKDIRINAEKISLNLEKLDHSHLNPQILMMRNLLLESEKESFYYFDSLDYSHAKKSIDSIAHLLNTYKAYLPHVSMNIGDNLEKNLETNIILFKTVILRALAQQRAYLMLNEVVMANEAYEILYFANEINRLTNKKITSTNHEINRMISKAPYIILGVGIIFLIGMLLTSLMLLHTFTKPIKSLTETFRRIINNDKKVIIPYYPNHDEIGSLTESARIFHKKSLDTEMELTQRVNKEIAKQRKQELVLIQQSKLASMGEMISAIAHQWRQPLNAIGLYFQDLLGAERAGELDRAYLKASVSKSMEQINYMSKTIDDFRNFFHPTVENSFFDIMRAIRDAMNLYEAQLKSNNIATSLTSTPESINIMGNPNHLRQVMLNLISNAIDAIKERCLKNNEPLEGEISIVVKQTSQKIIINVEDNGIGIKKENKDRIFEPYFTTKGEGKGSGIGLYMSSTILNNYFKGSLHLESIKTGARAKIILPREERKEDHDAKEEI